MFQRLLDRFRRPDPSVDPHLSFKVDESAVLMSMMRDLLADRRAERRSKLLRGLLVFVFPALLIVGFNAWAMGFRLWHARASVGVVELVGEMSEGSLASADKVVPALQKAFDSPSVKAVVLSIDSPGGAPLEAERIYTSIESMRRAHPKPVIAVVNNLGASAAYMVALHCDTIYAGKYSLVGSVGAVLAGWDFHKALDRVDVGQRVYTSGNLKAMLNPYLPMSPEANRKAQDLVARMGGQFREELETQRKGKLVPAQGVNFASGEIWGGVEAKQLGLIDEVATLDEVLRKRWPDLPVETIGPSSSHGGSIFAATITDWFRELLASEGLSQVSLSLR
jgi:protease-4